MSININDEKIANLAYKYALTLTTNPLDAEDLAHDAWLKIKRHRQIWLTKRYLFLTVRSIYLDRKSVLENRKRLDETYIQTEETTDTLSEENPIIWESFTYLNELEREIIYLNVLEGLSCQHISTMMNKPRGSILSSLSRGKKKLAKKYQDLGGER
jgi:RNA polymerase sigma factor (sigma-70 family)